MLVATAVMILGLAAGIAAAQLAGLRLTGVIIVPLSAVYLLKNFATFPVFTLSILAAYGSLWIVKRRLLLFGRTLFILSVSVGTVVLLLVFELIALGVGPGDEVAGFELLLSILPGIAAYNLHRLSSERRILDAVWSLATLLSLVVVGIGLVIAVGLSGLANFLPPVLLSSESDIAVAFGLTVADQPIPILASKEVIVALFIGGLIVSEMIRSRYGLRVAGVIVVPVVVLMSLRNAWMLPLWVLAAALTYAGIQLLHWWTLVYGRVLLSMSIIFGLFVAVSLAPVLPIRNGLLPFFVGVLAGVTSYNVHVLPRAERLPSVLVTGSVLVTTVALTRFVIVPPPAGLLTTVTGVHVAVGTLLLLPGLMVLYRFERRLPTARLVLDDTAFTLGNGRHQERRSENPGRGDRGGS